MSKAFQLDTDYQPAGDQPQAIRELVEGINAGLLHQTLLGVTGSGKTFTVANVIAELQRPAIIMAVTRRTKSGAPAATGSSMGGPSSPAAGTVTRCRAAREASTAAKLRSTTERPRAPPDTLPARSSRRGPDSTPW